MLYSPSSSATVDSTTSLVGVSRSEGGGAERDSVLPAEGCFSPSTEETNEGERADIKKCVKVKKEEGEERLAVHELGGFRVQLS